MTLKYIRENYGMPWLKRSVRVLALGQPGRVIRGDTQVWVMLDSDSKPQPYHPKDVVPEPAEEPTTTGSENA